MQSSLARHWPLPVLLLLIALGWLVYLPGLSGGFLFDDFVNLDALGRFGRVDDWPTFWRYITSGTADPVGRPLALLSFLADARDWPADPRPFLRSNVLIHMANGALLFALLRQLAAVLGDGRDRAAASALLASAAWLLHPLMVSTTLYAVQREAMLPATFILAGLLCYGHGRILYAGSAGARGGAWMWAGILFGTTLAILSKANGALLPVLALVLELTVLRSLPPTPAPAAARLRRWQLALLVAPSLLLLCFLLRPLAAANEVVGNRPWTTLERLLTQPRILLDYLQLLVVPRSVSNGLFNEGYAYSTSLLRPLSTTPAILLVSALVVFAASARRRWPALSAGLLFYFAGHLMESSTLPLELYFEHRNYLPALLLFWPLARGIVGWRRSVTVRTAVAVALVGLLAIICFQRTSLWGDPARMAAVWASRNADSSRAQAVAAIADIQLGQPRRALLRLRPLFAQNPADLQIGFNYIDARCATGGLAGGDPAALEAALLTSPGGALMVHKWLGVAAEVARRGSCPGLDLATAGRWIEAAATNPAYRNEDIEPLRARLAMAHSRPAQALLHFNRGLESKPGPGLAALQAATLANSGYYEQALAHLDHFERLKVRVRAPRGGMPRVHAAVLTRQQYWPKELALLRARLQSAIRERDRDG